MILSALLTLSLASSPLLLPDVALSQARVESYGALNRAQLLEQRRLLNEAKPGFILPLALAIAGGLPVGLGTGMLGYGGLSPNVANDSRTALYVGGGITAGVGLVAMAIGVVWLSR